MKILGLCCAKNSEAWVESVLRSHLTICDKVLFLDDGSTDRTGEIAQSFSKVEYWRQEGLPRNEARDRNWLFGKVHALNPAWCWWFDGDETLWRGTRADIADIPKGKNVLETMLLALWEEGTQYAADWSHPKHGIFRYIPSVCKNYRWKGKGPHKLHCGGSPKTDPYFADKYIRAAPIVELHWGWMTPVLCRDKLQRYRDQDPLFDEFPPYRRFEKAPRDIRPLVTYTGGNVERPRGLTMRGLLSPFRPIDAASVLDCGCGDGRKAEVYHEGLRVVGIELDKKKVTIASERLEECVCRDFADALDKIPAGAFDWVTFIDSVEHIEEERADKVLQDAKRIANLAVTVFVPEGDTSQWKTKRQGVHDHKSTWTTDRLEALGFFVKRLENYHGEKRSALLAHWRREL